MSDSLTSEQITNATQFREFLRQGLAEMDRLFALMAEDQKEIDRQDARTAVTLSEIHATSKINEAILATLKFL